MPFTKYQHVERWGTPEVEDIHMGKCYVFPKLDGTNSSVWWEDGSIWAGSRNRLLTLDNDNAGFLRWVLDNDDLCGFLEKNPDITLYGEWLVPHTLRTYREDAWRRFWVFDVYNRRLKKLLPFEEYSTFLCPTINQIYPQCVINNPTSDCILREVEANTYLVQDGMGAGEGVVVKNYDFINKYGRQVWAKWVRNEFKEDSKKAMGFSEKTGTTIPEAALAERFVTAALVTKTRAKIELELLEQIDPELLAYEALRAKRKQIIPRLLQTVYYDVVKEEIWPMLKFLPKSEQTINFSQLRRWCIAQTKKYAQDLF